MVRGDHLQESHLAHAVVLAADGSIRHQVGDPTQRIQYRSASKPLQATSSLRAGAHAALARAVDTGRITRTQLQRLLAIACASHASTPGHVAEARTLLGLAGLGEDALQCGGHEPLDPMKPNRPPGGWRPIHSNCSGKHALMLLGAVSCGADPATYLAPGSVVQKQILEDASAWCGAPLETGPDGCGAPTLVGSLVGLARGWWALGQNALGRSVLESMSAHPELVAGEGRACTQIMLGGAGRLQAKVGAAGIYVVRNHGTDEVLAVRIQDGSMEAAERYAAALAHHMGWLPSVPPRLGTDLRDTRGHIIGAWRFPLPPRKA